MPMFEDTRQTLHTPLMPTKVGIQVRGDVRALPALFCAGSRVVARDERQGGWS